MTNIYFYMFSYEAKEKDGKYGYFLTIPLFWIYSPFHMNSECNICLLLAVRHLYLLQTT